jgi:ketosteroid isomerase-like protein
MQTTAELDNELNQMILTGRALEAFDLLYADDVVMQENNDEPRVGKAVNRKFEEEFFASAVNGDLTFSQWFIDITLKGGHRHSMTQVAVRQWKNGKIAHERFFYKG